LGNDLALRHALGLDTYDMYCGHASSLVAVDIDVATTAFAGLFTAPGLRRQMGAAGRERARSLYDWKVIIPQYQALWAELTKLREANTAQTKPLAHPWPARMDPLHAFGAYPSQIIGPETLFELVDSDAESANARLASYRGLTMVDYARVVLPTEAETRIVLKNAGRNHEPVAAKDLLAGISDKRHPFVFRGLAWLLKLGILRIRA
jgi:alpha-maltose-1-phosphate synthase